MSARIGSDKDRTVDGALRTLLGERTSISPGAALGVLAGLGARNGEEGAKEAIDVLRRVVADGPDPQVRAGAATALAAIGTPEAVEVLRQTADDVPSAVALARVGDAADLDRMLALLDQAKGSSQRSQLEAAVRLLAHRVGTSIPADTDDTVLPAPQRGRPVEPREVQIDLRDVAPTDRSLVTEAMVPAAAVVCGDTVHHVLVDRERIAVVAREPAVAAVVLGANETTGQLFVRWLVLTDPSSDQGDVRVQIVQPRGARVFVGRGRIDGEQWEAELASVERPGASAVSVKVAGSPEGVRIDGVSDAVIAVPRRVPTQLVAGEMRPR
ncbi:HEAT repeat protein [Branchiibius hedensis]|uniref:HEAT repeat-containing protein n=1 Tax=Branchiibius hedensis TaxID=672460 RepID=A0A2Y8ZYN5_9MICO|nr:HEAT repeat domain-containing protein [Branchiibius hedensis]PWJ26205.1 HEAT repeat protein [Branchiibius hedensis]SSA35017.1 HEAT repeat-containing protein [Branchiibius hedensis]